MTNYKNEFMLINGSKYTYKEFERTLFLLDKTEGKKTFDLWKLANKEENAKKWVYYKNHVLEKAKKNKKARLKRDRKMNVNFFVFWLSFIAGVSYFIITG